MRDTILSNQIIAYIVTFKMLKEPKIELGRVAINKELFPRTATLRKIVIFDKN